MNPTIKKFGYPATLLKELGHWVILLRPAQVTLGSLILAAKGDVAAYSELPSVAFVEQQQAVVLIERALRDFCQYERINYLMLMMVDPNVHFHVIPRYSTPRSWNGTDYPDVGWPAFPQLGTAIELNERQIQGLAAELSKRFH